MKLKNKKRKIFSIAIDTEGITTTMKKSLQLESQPKIKQVHKYPTQIKPQFKTQLKIKEKRKRKYCFYRFDLLPRP